MRIELDMLAPLAGPACAQGAPPPPVTPRDDPRSVEQKLADLRAVIRTYESVIVVFSAGADSTLVAKVAADVLGERALAVTSASEVCTSAKVPPTCTVPARAACGSAHGTGPSSAQSTLNTPGP